MKFALASICNRSNQIVSFIGTPDTYDRTHTMLTKFKGTYQPKRWFAVVESSAVLGSVISKPIPPFLKTPPPVFEKNSL